MFLHSDDVMCRYSFQVPTFTVLSNNYNFMQTFYVIMAVFISIMYHFKTSLHFWVQAVKVINKYINEHLNIIKTAW